MSTAKFKIESGMQLLARLIKKPELHNFYPVLFQNGLKGGDIIEISSENNISCFLIDLICEALTPSKFGGTEVGVLLFNTDGNINYEDLLSVMRTKISSRLKPASTGHNVEHVDNILRDTLDNLYMLEVYDATQFYTTIHKLESILFEHSNISLIIFDTLTAFYWSEQGFKITKMDLYVKSLIRFIQKVTKEYKITIIYTRPQYFSSKKYSDNADSVAQLPTELVNYRIQLSKNHDCKGMYEVEVRTSQMQFTKYFHVIEEGEFKWL